MAAGAAGVAATGFVVYKSVQTASGGTVRVAFGSSDPKHAVPPQPLPPPSSSVVVWSEEGSARTAAHTLESSGKFRSVQWDAGTPAENADARRSGYDDLCHRHRADIVFSTVDEGQTVNSNMLSFKRGDLTHKLSLEGFGCTSHQIVWADTMAVVVEAGNKPIPQSEVDEVTGQAWAERIAAAKG
jgi:hypothetical protein